MKGWSFTMAHKRTELQRILRILRILYYSLKGLAILLGGASAILLFMGFAGEEAETGMDFSLFLYIKLFFIILGLISGFISFIMVKGYNYVDSSICFLEIELSRINNLEKINNSKKEKQLRFLEYIESLFPQ